MNKNAIIVFLGMLCLAYVWGKPVPKNEQEMKRKLKAYQSLNLKKISEEAKKTAIQNHFRYEECSRKYGKEISKKNREWPKKLKKYKAQMEETRKSVYSNDEILVELKSKMDELVDKRNRNFSSKISAEKKKNGKKRKTTLQQIREIRASIIKRKKELNAESDLLSIRKKIKKAKRKIRAANKKVMADDKNCQDAYNEMFIPKKQEVR